MQLEQLMFQSTYLYKVRPVVPHSGATFFKFQSTYLYKVRPSHLSLRTTPQSFQSTYLYKVRHYRLTNTDGHAGFNPRTYIRYDSKSPSLYTNL